MFIHPNFGRILGAGHFAAAVTFAQDATAASASLEAAVAAAGAFVVLAGAGGMAYGWVTYKSLVELRKSLCKLQTANCELRSALTQGRGSGILPNCVTVDPWGGYGGDYSP